MIAIPLCRDCRWSTKWLRCEHPNIGSRSIITGEWMNVCIFSARYAVCGEHNPKFFERRKSLLARLFGGR